MPVGSLPCTVRRRTHRLRVSCWVQRYWQWGTWLTPGQTAGNALRVVALWLLSPNPLPWPLSRHSWSLFSPFGTYSADDGRATIGIRADQSLHLGGKGDGLYRRQASGEEGRDGTSEHGWMRQRGSKPTREAYITITTDTFTAFTITIPWHVI